MLKCILSVMTLKCNSDRWILFHLKDEEIDAY